MNDKPKILIQLDSDQHPSVFDSVVAVDSGVQQLLTFGMVEPLDVAGLVHGAMFTRGVDSLSQTAIFIGGSKVRTAEQVLRAVTETFFGPLRVSVMMDANGANTTAAAAVLCLQRHMDVAGQTIGVLAATGSVGNRIARILAGEGANVRVASRSYERAEKLCQLLEKEENSGSVTPWETGGHQDCNAFLKGCDGLISAGAAGIQLATESQWRKPDSLRVAIDLNAVPPAGIEGIEVTAKGQEADGKIVYGAIGVGDLKMKIHKQGIRSLFETNDRVLDVDEIYALGKTINTP